MTLTIGISTKVMSPKVNVTNVVISAVALVMNKPSTLVCIISDRKNTLFLHKITFFRLLNYNAQNLLSILVFCTLFIVRENNSFRTLLYLLLLMLPEHRYHFSLLP